MLEASDNQIIEDNHLMRKIGDDIFFTEKFPLRMDLRSINVVDIGDINFVLVSTF